MAIILGIESSCDETSASICVDGKIMNNEIASQQIHSTYGGVVPELASRAHLANIIPVVDHVLNQSSVRLSDLDAIAYTQGPGLLGALLVGSSYARSLASALGIPVLPVHHMHAHILAHFIELPSPDFPFLCLTVSGGHTQIVKIESPLQMNIIGETLDDAVGEAFDKAAKLLGLTYPGGPLIDKLAAQGNENRFSFSVSQMDALNYSFSGIKTSILYFLQAETRKNTDFIKENLEDLAASIQKHLIDMLMEKLIKAAKQENINQIAIAGGVAANRGLRARLDLLARKYQWEVFIPKFEYCTDNAAMIAKAGDLYYQQKKTGSLSESPLPRMPFSEG